MTRGSDRRKFSTFPFGQPLPAAAPGYSAGMTRKSTRRWVRSIGVATVLAMITAGCAIAGAHSVAADPPSTPSSAVQVAGAEPVDTSVPKRMPGLSDLASGTLIATGEFGGRGTTGRIEIRTNGTDQGFDVALTGISPVPPGAASLELNALPPTASDSELQQGFSYYRYDPLQQVPEQSFSTPSAGYGGFESNDPTFMRTAVIWAAPPGWPIGLGSVVATAPLTWDLPDMNPGLEVVDHGAAEGAYGQVGLAADGAPMSYRVAWGDTPKGITERFGITLRDLEWLNPDRLSGRLVLADITLNLSRESRGLRQ